MPLQLRDKWIWDFWLVQDQDLWHIFFLQADKSLGDPELRHRNVSIGHATSRDLHSWSHLGTCFAPSQERSFDDWTTWTGSVVRGTDGTWHLFYTGTAHEGGGLHQRIGHATSDDLHSWRRVGNGLALDLSGADYEEYTPGGWRDRSMRDPWVMRDPAGDGWVMYFTARVPGHVELNAGAAIGYATSPDLLTWTLQPPVYAGGTFSQMEVPQVFEHGGRWYCLFTTWAVDWSEAYRRGSPQSPVSGTHYLIAADPKGPWRIAPGAFLDGAEPARRYASKVVKDADGKLFIMGFIHTTATNPFVGEVSDPIPVTVDQQGYLSVRLDLLPSGAIV
ncbi:glycoside hydrolase family 68 protein [Devosia sp. 66-22]|uniref:glycoside hydrolase family 68 protein n=1 Tax=Devosia sp. 66-22 TaxID=1895753 RepID=UPI000929EA1C|nr:glycoside hydrolase family 68 protein [Devosia sp. 66-22]OJX47843.1 MAG: levansucrase [Devosia sp. 66-22]